MVGTAPGMALLAFPSRCPGTIWLETSPAGSSDVAVLFEGQEHLSRIDANCAAAPYVLRAEKGAHAHPVGWCSQDGARVQNRGWQSGDSWLSIMRSSHFT